MTEQAVIYPYGWENIVRVTADDVFEILTPDGVRCIHATWDSDCGLPGKISVSDENLLPGGIEETLFLCCLAIRKECGDFDMSQEWVEWAVGILRDKAESGPAWVAHRLEDFLRDLVLREIATNSNVNNPQSCAYAVLATGRIVFERKYF